MVEDEESLFGADGPDGEGGGASSIDPIAAAAAMEAARYDPELSRRAARYLEEQQALVRLQIKHFDEEHRLSHEAARRRRYADRIRNGLLTLAGLIVVGAVGFAAILVRDAMNDHGLVIEPFSVPADIAATGLTGDVVASRLLDKLNALQSATESERPAGSYENNWGQAIKLQIPEAGISLGELQNLLREKLGHVTYITGEVLRTSSGIAITARWSNAAPQTFSGKLDDFDALAQQSAEAVYRESQPFRYAEYLYQHGRVAEAAADFAEIAVRGPALETGWALSQSGNIELNDHGDVRAARTTYARAFALGNPMGGVGLINVELWSGHDEKVLEYSNLIEIQSRTRAPDTTEDFFEANRLISQGYLEGQLGDFKQSAADLRQFETETKIFSAGLTGAAATANSLALDHDPGAATAEVPQYVDDISFLRLDADQGWISVPVYWIAAARGDWRTALADARSCDAWLEAHTPQHRVFGLVRGVFVVPLEALARAKTGDVAGAQALIATTPRDCYLCARVRGEIAATKKDWANASRWFGEAVHLAPSIPFAYSEWGSMLMRNGDLDSAIAKFKAAHDKGPHFADPLEMWGEALMQENRSDLALPKFAEAAQFAPNWGRLHLKWGEALFYAGRKDDARRQLDIAAQLILSDRDSAQLTHMRSQHG